ncbi:Uncharacterised protein [Mycobacterium tuberculosis]|uniref:Uncharacterized protein n=1 Tax=Mycobacterium tuberculosis TaxID=1773 RepID=A0A916LG96_MYCTX|nr:Uncharacterised protein [Mycobacterium tuberculosis]
MARYKLTQALASWSQPNATSIASTIATMASTAHRNHQYLPRGGTPSAGGAPTRVRGSAPTRWRRLRAGASCDTCLRVTVQVAP